MAMRMPYMDGVEASRRLAEDASPAAIPSVLIARHHVDEELWKAVRGGLRGYVLKGSPPNRVVEAVREVAAGRGFVDPAVVRQLREQAARLRAELNQPQLGAVSALHDWEAEVARMVAEGRLPGEAGRMRPVSPRPVRSQLARLLRRLGLRKPPRLGYRGGYPGVSPVAARRN